MVAKVSTLKNSARRKRPPMLSAVMPPSASGPHARYSQAKSAFIPTYISVATARNMGHVTDSSAWYMFRYDSGVKPSRRAVKLPSRSMSRRSFAPPTIDPSTLRHPLCFYIPKSESADEALWWRDVFAALARARGWNPGDIRCMALVESHPLAFEMEEFLWNLRDHIVGLNLGRWDYMASLIHFQLADPRWVLPDRNTIPHDVPFFQNLRSLLVDICHRRKALAIGGMTALYPSREDPELNARALAVLEQDKRNESRCFMDGAWTGHPDQNAIAVAQFPAPNQIGVQPPLAERYPDLRPDITGVGSRTVAGMTPRCCK